MERTLIIVAGMPASGKTTFADYLSQTLRLPLVCKDRIKETLWERTHYDGSIREEAQKYGGMAYDLSFHFCQCLMQTGMPLIFESNLGAACPPDLARLVERYGYRVITVLFDGDMETVHRRFLEREQTTRHPGLVSGSRFADLETFTRAMAPCREFSYGDRVLRVDTTDFDRVSYADIVKQITAEQHV